MQCPERDIEEAPIERLAGTGESHLAGRVMLSLGDRPRRLRDSHGAWAERRLEAVGERRRCLAALYGYAAAEPGMERADLPDEERELET